MDGLWLRRRRSKRSTVCVGIVVLFVVRHNDDVTLMDCVPLCPQGYYPYMGINEREDLGGFQRRLC